MHAKGMISAYMHSCGSQCSPCSAGSYCGSGVRWQGAVRAPVGQDERCQAAEGVAAMRLVAGLAAQAALVRLRCRGTWRATWRGALESYQMSYQMSWLA